MAVGGVIIIAVGLYGAYRVYKHFKRLSVQSTPVTQVTSAPTTVANLKDLIAKGITESCTYKTDNSSGSIYMNGGKVRADITTQAEGQNSPTISHMIITDGFTYLWTDDRSTGIKMTYNPNATPSATGTTNNSSEVLNPDLNLNYVCSPWGADTGKFTLPTNINFMEFNAQVPVQTSGPTGSSSQCSYCDNLSGTQKTSCLSALNCQ